MNKLNDWFYFCITNNIHSSWYHFFYSKFDILKQILHNINFYNEYSYLPPKKLIFTVFTNDINNIKIILLAQDPYYTIDKTNNKPYANGLAFSVSKENNHYTLPPSLINIFKEIKAEYPDDNIEFKHGDLTNWFNNGIFLLNCSLTVEAGKAGSHMEIWEKFTDEVIKYISDRGNKIFVLLGNFAKKKNKLINKSTKINNYIIEGIHPSPLSAYNGFFNSGIFIKINEIYYKLHGKYFNFHIQLY